MLCTQVLPLECSQCVPATPPLKPTTTLETYTIEADNETCSRSGATHTESKTPLPTPSFLGEDVGVPLASPNVEKHPYFKRPAQLAETAPQYQFGRGQGETCASCTFTVPQNVAQRLPAGAPGSTRDGLKSKNGAPVLRSREFVCLGRGLPGHSSADLPSSQESTVPAAESCNSTLSQHEDCHDHTLTYLTTKSPHTAENYTQLRASVIRALSFEVLPRGLSEGPLCFGDSSSGHTIAYVFRLTDPQARGKRRAYAFVALAGTDPHRAFKACPLLWKAFATISRVIEEAAQKNQEETERELQMQRQAELERGDIPGYIPLSSFLSNRAVDPDGYPRRARQTQPRSLAEIVGDENIFAVLHQYFIAVLRALGDRFGGLPLASKLVYQPTTNKDHGTSNGQVIANVAERVLDALASDNNRGSYNDGTNDVEETFNMSFGHPTQSSSADAGVPLSASTSYDANMMSSRGDMAFQQQIRV